jgi:hypothetical protein
MIRSPSLTRRTVLISFLLIATAASLVVSAPAATLKPLSPYIVVLKPTAELTTVEQRVATRSGSADEPKFTARIDKAHIYSALPGALGFRMLSTEEAAAAMRNDPDVRIVERDTMISVDGF